MNHLERLFHDLKDSFVVLEKHAQGLLASLPLEQRMEKPESLGVEAALCQIRSLLEQWQTASSEENIQEIEAIPLARWSSMMDKEILPPLSQMHRMAVLFEGRFDERTQIVMNLPSFQSICCNLMSNARAAGASLMHIEVKDQGHCVDLIFRDNGCGMTPAQIDALGLGFTSQNSGGHGQGFRIVRKLSADFGAIVRRPKSIRGLGTEIVLSVMKVGCSLA